MGFFTESATPPNIEAFVNKFRRHLINSHLENIILNCLENQHVCGYDIISFVHDRFRVLLSPGQVYPVINYLVESGLVSKHRQERRVLLGLTPSGQQLLKAWNHELNLIQAQLSNQLMLEPDVTS